MSTRLLINALIFHLAFWSIDFSTLTSSLQNDQGALEALPSNGLNRTRLVCKKDLLVFRELKWSQVTHTLEPNVSEIYNHRDREVDISSKSIASLWQKDLSLSIVLQLNSECQYLRLFRTKLSAVIKCPHPSYFYHAVMADLFILPVTGCPM